MFKSIDQVCRLRGLKTWLNYQMVSPDGQTFAITLPLPSAPLPTVRKTTSGVRRRSLDGARTLDQLQDGDRVNFEQLYYAGR